MTPSERLDHRARAIGLALSPELATRLLAYLDLLAFWNRRVNLVAFDLSAPGDRAIDRLLVEPVVACRLVRPDDRRAVDIGSGGGSPAIPLMLAVPELETTLIEARVRKAAFLREAIRTLGVSGEVRVERVEEAAPSMGRIADLVTFRAVRADAGLWAAVDGLLALRGRVLWFGGVGHIANINLNTVAAEGDTAALERRVQLPS